MAGGDTSFEFFSISRAVLPEYLGQFAHGRSAIRRLMVWAAISSVRLVKWV
jgi:hypothetical protein